jgi:hypothetical protein
MSKEVGNTEREQRGDSIYIDVVTITGRVDKGMLAVERLHE